MKLSEDYSPGSNIIRSYQSGQIDINGNVFSRSLVVSNRTLIENWAIQDISELKKEHLLPILDLKPEVILIGTGSRLVFPSADTYYSVIHQGIGIEFMDSGAACRTFNILLSEDRPVVAGIIL